MRHPIEISRNDSAIDVLAQGQGELGTRAKEFGGLNIFPQPDYFTLAIWHLYADRGLACHAFNQDALGFQCQAEIIRQVGDAAVFDSRFRLELESCHYRSRI